MWSRAASEGPIGLVAGYGDFPALFAQAARTVGRPVVVFGIEGITDRGIEKFSGETHYVRWGELGRLFDLIKSKSIKRIVLAGGIPKKRIYDPSMKLDDTAQDFLKKSSNKGDDHLLRSLEVLFRVKCGATVIDSRSYLKEALMPKGVLTRRRPSDKEMKDLKQGLSAARHVGRMDIGQTIVIKDGMIVAVEALEGTDQAIRRGGELAGPGSVVVKACKPNQSLRFDLPCVGADTVAAMRSVSAGVLGVESGKALILSRAEFVQAADNAGICVIGL